MHLDVCNLFVCWQDWIGLSPWCTCFACHMFLHFPMHTFSTFQYTYYLNYFGAFLIVSFFPLSILFTLVVSIAPKCKSTQAQNPLHSDASSSSDQAPLSLCFCNDNAHKAFTESFSWQGIHSKCRVILGHFADIDLPTVIHNREWESLCDEPVTCSLVLIQEFYPNMHGFDYSLPHFVTHVRGISILVTPQLVADVFRVPRIEFPNYPSYERPLEWGERQFTYCSSFAKGPWFLNMVMTFVLYPLVREKNNLQAHRIVTSSKVFLENKCRTHRD